MLHAFWLGFWHSVCAPLSWLFIILILRMVAPTIVRPASSDLARAAAFPIVVALAVAIFIPTSSIMGAALVMRTGGTLGEVLLEDLALSGPRHIHAPAREAGSQARVLPILADRQGKLLLHHCHQGRVVRLAQFHLQGFYRAERIRHKGRLVGTPLDNIDFFIVQFMHNVIDA